jgi:hypothetical protein
MRYHISGNRIFIISITNKATKEIAAIFNDTNSIVSSAPFIARASVEPNYKEIEAELAKLD